MTPTSAMAQVAIQAARRFGTPFYLYDLDRLRTDAAALREAFPDPWLRLYSLKANGLPGVVREIAAQGFGASAVSRGELAIAQRAGLDTSSIAVEGIGKADADLAAAVALAAAGTPLLWISLESAEEAAALASHAADAGVRVDVLVRVNPEVAPETIRGLAVGAAASKFGALAEELPSVIEAGGGPGGPLRWRGIHVHVGSQLGAVDAWRSALRVGLRLLGLQQATLTDFDTLDTGGGFPVEMGDAADQVSVPSPATFAAHATTELDKLAPAARPARLAIEPGRAVVAGCGWLVASVLHVRRRDPPIIVLDAGMSELIRPALYGAHHPMIPLTSFGHAPPAAGSAAIDVRVDGPVCESTDTFGPAQLPALRRGDLVAIGMVGAYGSAMASTYNGRPVPPEIACDNGRLTVLRRRGSGRTLP